MVAGVPGATVVLDWTERALGQSPRSIVGRHEGAPAAALQVSAPKELRSDLHEEEVVAASPEPVADPTSITGIIHAAAAEFGLDGDYLLSVAVCESNLDPAAYNAAGYHGLFQFDQSTWASYGYGSIYDPSAQARTAARLIAAGQSSRWPNCA